MWPISPAVLRPTHGLPSRIRPPPTPVPQNTPSRRVVLLRGADLELGVGREVDVVAERDRAPPSSFSSALRRLNEPAHSDRFMAPETVPFLSSTLPGEPTPTPARSETSSPASSSDSSSTSAMRAAIAFGPPFSGVWSRLCPEHRVVGALVHDRGLDLGPAEVDAAVDRHGWHLARWSATSCSDRWRSGLTIAGGSRCPRDTSSRSTSTALLRERVQDSRDRARVRAGAVGVAGGGPRRATCSSGSGRRADACASSAGSGCRGRRCWSSAAGARSAERVAAARRALEHGIGMNLGGGTHHAGRDFARGYCLFNDVAVTLARLRSRGPRAARAGRRLRRPPGRRHRPAARPGPGRVHAVAARRPQLPVRADPVRPRRRPALRHRRRRVPARRCPRRSTSRSEPADADIAFFLAGADPWEGDRLGRLALTKDGLRARDELVLDRLLRDRRGGRRRARRRLRAGRPRHGRHQRRDGGRRRRARRRPKLSAVPGA